MCGMADAIALRQSALETKVPIRAGSASEVFGPLAGLSRCEALTPVRAAVAEWRVHDDHHGTMV